GICVERSLEMLVGILGVLKAGGAYVPLDPKYPSDRIAFMIEDAELRLVLTQRHLVKDIPRGHAAVFCIDDQLQSIANQNEEIYPALACGATIVLRTDAMISSARDFLRSCDEWKISVLDLPTAYWHDLTDALSAEKLIVPASVRLVIIGGEKALPERVRAWKRA